MNGLTTSLTVLALLGSALVGGIFFAFSSFIMKALGRVPSAEGIAAMQSINVVVINPSFLGAFFGTALLSLAVAVLAVQAWGTPAAACLLAGAVSYLVGTILVTMLGNVPLNDRLAGVSAVSAEAAELWTHYLSRWTMLNTVRTVAAMLAALLFTAGLVQGG